MHGYLHADGTVQVSFTFQHIFITLRVTRAAEFPLIK